MSRVEELNTVKELIKEHLDDATAGMYFTRNIEGDTMHTLYKGTYFTLDICSYWGYYELFGCTNAERCSIKAYYEALVKKIWEED